VDFAHQRNCKVYVVLNSFLHDKDLLELPEFLKLLEELHVDAVIVSDLGVIETIRKNSQLVIHLSTQASCLNIQAALFWKEMGVTRIVLGREVTILEARKIKEATGLEIEMFIHGSMCMSYSGNCVISNYTQGRDSNRGGCAQSCRFEYSLDFENKKDLKAFFMSSKDLEGIRLMSDFIDAGIDSLKVEGRNKSHHYAGTISKVYSDALRFYQNHGHFLSSDILLWEKELRKISHRDYTTGSLDHYAGNDSIYDERQHDEHEYVVCGVVLEVVQDQYILLDVKSTFLAGDVLELMPFKESIQVFVAEFIKSLSGADIFKTKPGSVVKLPFHPNALPWNIMRKEK
jgi:putative protease